MLPTCHVSSPRIQLLTPRLANQIAAGEVVERPASVVKELLENSLDAGATRIDIEIERGGIQLIRISDNGNGIHPDDLPLALARHATSKIATIDDLAAVMSLGFRGEALASIASVAKLLLSSRRRGESTAWQAFAEGAGMQVQVQPAALSEGTRIEVRDLFFNTPARRRFLRSEATEFAHIEDVVRRMALARADVSFSLKHNGRGIRHWRAGRAEQALTERLGAVLGRSFLVTAQPLDLSLDQVHLHGYVGHPDQHRAQADGQFVFVNGRAIRDRVVSHAIRAGFADRIPPGRSPCYALFLDLPATDVDVNVHPTKHEVRFRNARWLHDWLTRSVADAVARTQEQIDPETGEVTPAIGVFRYPSSEPSAAVLTTSALSPSAPATAVMVSDSRATAFAPAPTPLARSHELAGLRQPRDAFDAAVAAARSAETMIAAPVRAGLMPFSPSSAAFADAANQPWLQRVSAQLLLDCREPARLWPMQPLLQAWLQEQWFAAETIATLPLLLPVPIPALPPAALAQLRDQGFDVSDGQLRAAPTLLRGANWSQLLVALSAATAAQWTAIAANHLLTQACSQTLAYWRPIVSWASDAAAELSVVPTASQWEVLWQQ